MAKANPKLQWGAVANRANQAEKYLRWFVEFCPVPIAMFDCDLRYILVSQPWVKMLGIPRLKLIGTDIHDSLAITQAHQQGLERCLTGGQMHYSTEVEIVIRGNESKLFQWEVQPWYTDDGAAGGVIISSQPLADRKEDRISDRLSNHHSSEDLKRHLAEEVLERKYLEDAFNQIGTALESASDAVCIVDLASKPIYINSAFNDLFDYDLQTLQQSINFQSLFVNPQIAAEVSAAVIQGDAWAGEIEMSDRHQQNIPIALRVNPVKRSTGVVIGTTYICTNILDRKVAEEEINKSFAALGAILEATADSILVLDAIGNIIICNQKFVDLLGIPDRIFTSHDDSHILQYMVAKILSSSHLHNFGKDLSEDQNTFEIVRLDDGRTLECYSQPQNSMHSSGNSSGGRVWSLRDITERLADESLVRASEEKYRLQAAELEKALYELKNTQSQLIQAEKMSGLGQLVAGIAHEINNPVNFIYGNLAYADTYTSDLLNLIKLYGAHYPNPVEPIQQKLQEIDIDFIGNDFLKLISSIRVGAERIQGIVRSLNNFSRSDEAKFKLVDIHDGLDSTLMILQSRLKGTTSRPKILVDKNYGDLPEVECYAGQLNQVFMNLLTNAIDALEEDALTNGAWQIINNQPEWIRQDGKVSKISIYTEVQTNSQNDKFLIIKVADNAGGIREELRNRLFDLFFTTKPVGKGTGLGLSIAYQIVTENHGGKLSFNSEIGKGSEFVIEIPLK
jgi:signal transduction histidine kinase